MKNSNNPYPHPHPPGKKIMTLQNNSQNWWTWNLKKFPPMVQINHADDAGDQPRPRSTPTTTRITLTVNTPLKTDMKSWPEGTKPTRTDSTKDSTGWMHDDDPSGGPQYPKLFWGSKDPNQNPDEPSYEQIRDQSGAPVTDPTVNGADLTQTDRNCQNQSDLAEISNGSKMMEHPEDKCCKRTKFKCLTDLKEDTEHQENNFLCEFNTYLHFLCSEKNFFWKEILSEIFRKST